MALQKYTRHIPPLLRLAAPVTLAHLANMSMQLVDTLFVGRLGPEAIGGTSVANSIFSSLMVFAIGLLLGMDFLVAHAFGSRDQDECRRLLGHGVLIAVAISLPSIALMYLCSGYFDDFGVVANVAAQADAYLKAVSWSLLPMLIFTAIRQYLQAQGIALPIMIIMVLGNLVNILGNWMFIFGHLGAGAHGVAGAGIATTFARSWMLVVLGVYIYWRDRQVFSRFCDFSGEKLRKLLKLGIPASLQLLLEVGVFALATLLVARLGAIPLAAHQIVLLVASFTFMVPLGLSSAAAVRVGQALGENKKTHAQEIGWVSIFCGALFMFCSGVLLFVFGRPLLGAFTRDASVIFIGQRLLLIAAAFQVFDGIQTVGSGVLRGVGNTRASMIANFCGHWMLGLPVGMLFCFQFHWGAQGLWIGLSVGLAAVAVALTWVWSQRSKQV